MGFTPGFIPFASISVIWFVATVIFVRQEVTSPLPYLWPIPIFLLFKLFAGNLSLSLILTGLFLATIISALSTSRDGLKNWGAWFGLTFLIYASISKFTGNYPLLLLAVPAVLNLFPETKKLAFYLFFASSILANIAVHILT
jgi:hypothetical protein